MRFGLYFSLFEWFHPLFLSDQANHFRTQRYVSVRLQKSILRQTFSKLAKLVSSYLVELSDPIMCRPVPCNYATDY